MYSVFWTVHDAQRSCGNPALEGKHPNRCWCFFVATSRQTCQEGSARGGVTLMAMMCRGTFASSRIVSLTCLLAAKARCAFWIHRCCATRVELETRMATKACHVLPDVIGWGRFGFRGRHKPWGRRQQLRTQRLGIPGLLLIWGPGQCFPAC